MIPYVTHSILLLKYRMLRCHAGVSRPVGHQRGLLVANGACVDDG
jgi:hypothetical protein